MQSVAANPVQKSVLVGEVGTLQSSLSFTYST
jgi:hypothetical protein